MKKLTLYHTNPTKHKIAYTAILLFNFFNISNAQITLTAPSEGTELTAGNPITITANVTVGNVSNVTFWVDNDEGDWKWIDSQNGKPGQNQQYNTNYIVKPGTKKIRARVTYSGGTANTEIDVSTSDNGGSSGVAIIITTPEGTTLPAGSSINAGSLITISTTANNISNVTFWSDNDEKDWDWMGSATTSPYQVTYTVKPGTDKIRARVVHLDGTTSNAEITVNTNNNGSGGGAAVEITTSEGTTLPVGSPITITANVTANNANNVTFWVDNDEGDWKWVGSTTKSPYQVTYTVKPGTDKIRACVVHLNGTTSNVEITVNTNNNGGNTAAFPTGFVIGLEAGDAIDRNSGVNSMTNILNNNKNRFQYLTESEAKFVRINFYKPRNYTGSDFGWIAKYDAVVNELGSRNIPIYAVVTDVVGGTLEHESRPTSYPTRWGDYWKKKEWIDKYAAAFAEITKRYKGKITHYESFNEPNNWIPDSNEPAMTFDDYAYLLQKTWNSVKAGGNPNNITLISGPVLAHDKGLNSFCEFMNQEESIYNNGACYLKKAIEHNGGTAYFDAAGYHIYVVQDSGDPATGVQRSADALKNMLQAKGLSTDIYISEVGWDSDRVSANTQVNFIEQGLNKLRSLKNSHRIKGVCLFSLSDFQTPSITEKFGLVSPDYMNNGNGFEKASWNKFKSMYKGN